MSGSRIIEGVFGSRVNSFPSPSRLRLAAIDKPKSVASTQLLREIQRAFNQSESFRPWLDAETHKRQRENAFQRRRRRDRSVQVKLGHGGTLDPLATGVLIIGIGRGTKHLQQFLECTKCYDATILFGAATDTYDITGNIVDKSSAQDITKEKVEEALERFRGEFLQRPPLFSALRMQGKRLYEYAREGKELPAEIQERPVSVKDICIEEWLPANYHGIEFLPEDVGVRSVKRLEEPLHTVNSNTEASRASRNGWTKPGMRTDHVSDEPKAILERSRSSAMVESTSSTPEEADSHFQKTAPGSPSAGFARIPAPPHDTHRVVPGPAARVRMTVSSGFYVRALCHDLGKAVGSFGVMAALTRVRQGHFELGKNVLPYDNLCRGEEVWGPQLRSMLDDWKDRLDPVQNRAAVAVMECAATQQPDLSPTADKASGLNKASAA